MGSTKIEVTPTHVENPVLFILNVGIRGCGKSQCFGYLQTAIKKMETLERESATSEVDRTSSKRKKDEPDPLSFARCISFSTMQGLEDILQSKQDSDKETSIMLCVDEMSGLLANILKDKQVESSFGSLFNATTMRSSTRSVGLVNVESPKVNIIGK